MLHARKFLTLPPTCCKLPSDYMRSSFAPAQLRTAPERIGYQVRSSRKTSEWAFGSWGFWIPTDPDFRKGFTQVVENMVGPNGLEPSTSSVSRKRSNQTELRAYSV